MRAEWIISEAGIQSLDSAGISTGWLKAWLLAAGAAEVSLALFESGSWRQSEADWQLFFADASELEGLALQQGESFELSNPPRSCRHLKRGEGGQTLLLPLGDIAYQRQHYLSRLNPGKPLPLYVCRGNDGDISLEPGLSGSLVEPAFGLLNDQGLLIEEQVVAALRREGLGLRSVESCTAGAIAARIARLPGASDVLDRAWVTYSNEAKCDEVGVSADLVDKHGAVSEPVVKAMAEGGSDERHACVAVSGIAGPDGGTADKPVGTVWVAVAVPDHMLEARCFRLKGSRSEIQAATVMSSLVMLLEAVG